jgi:DNA polymerase-4
MIIHADMDAFFASVEIREQPELQGLPVVVGGRPEQRGVVAAASYVARRYGIRSAMPMAAALQRCPQLVILPGRMALYSAVSRQIHDIFARFTPLIEPLSLDEAFLDVSASTQLFGPAPDIARQIKQAVHDELRLVVSVGVAPNKFLAKIASDLNKPDGFLVVEAEQVQAFLDPLPVSRLWGVGKVTEQQLQRLNIHTIADLRRQPEAEVSRLFGAHGRHLWRLAHGQDDRAVVTDSEAKSVSHETTFAQDISDTDTLRAVLLDLTEQVAWRLRRQQLRGRTVQLKLRFHDFRTITRAHSLTTATDATRELWQTVRQLLDTELNKYPQDKGLPPVRLIGMGVGGFGSEEHSEQLSLFQQAAPKTTAVDSLTDAINQRFGKRQLARARSVRKPD